MNHLLWAKHSSHAAAIPRGGEDAFLPYAGGALFNSAHRAGRWVETDFSPACRAICSGDILRDVLTKSGVITALQPP